MNVPEVPSQIETVRREDMLTVEHLSYTYARTEASVLTDINLTISPGDTIGIVGESGSGKTTLLYTLSGIIPHFFRDGMLGGQVNLGAVPIAERNLLDVMGEVKLVFQDPEAQYSGASVEDVIAFGLENMAVPRNQMQERMDRVMQDLDIFHLRGRMTQSLSGGERQAVMLASILAMEPEILLFDEIISALDVRGQERVRQVFGALRERGQTMVVVDTDLSWLAENVDRVVVLNQGNVVYEGDPASAYADPSVADAAGVGTEYSEPFRRPEMHAAPVIRLSGVSYGYGSSPEVLTDVSFDVRAGSCTAIVGGNGSGKTTLAKIIAGLYEPRRGSVSVGGVKPYTLSSHELVETVGYVFQNPARMFVADTVAEEFAYTPRQIGKVPSGSLAAFALEQYSERSPWELSAGQQQRLAIASVLSTQPRVVIFDEPTFGQSRRERQRLVTQIRNLQEGGTTVVVISHDPVFVRQAAEYVYVLNSGHVVDGGLAADVLPRSGNKI